MIIGAVTLRLVSRLAWHVHVRTNKWAYALERVELKLKPNQMPAVQNVRVGGAYYAADEVPGYLVPVSFLQTTWHVVKFTGLTLKATALSLLGFRVRWTDGRP